MSEEKLPPSPVAVSEEPRRWRGGQGISIALILIAVGAVALLTNLGVIGLDWSQVARFWPIVLILIGLDLVLGRVWAPGGLVVAVLTVGAIAGVVWLAQAPAQVAGGLASGAIHVPFSGVKALKVVVKLSAVPLDLRAGESTSAVQGQYKLLVGTQPDVTYHAEGDTGVVTLTQPPVRNIPFNVGPQKLALTLPKGIPISLQVESNLGQTTLDLSGLEITDLDVKAGSGQLAVTLPGQGKLGDVRIEGNLGQVTVSVPADVSLDMASYTVKSGSGSLSVDLPAKGVLGDVVIKGDLGSVSVNIPGGAQGVSVKSLQVEAGSGSMEVILPDQGDYTVVLKDNLGSITLTLPPSLEAQVSIDTSLGEANVENSRLKSTADKVWETSDYQSASNRATVTIKAGSGSVTLK